MPAHKEQVKKISNRRAFKEMSLAQQELVSDMGLVIFWLKNTLTEEQQEAFMKTLENTKVLKTIIV